MNDIMAVCIHLHISYQSSISNNSFCSLAAGGERGSKFNAMQRFTVNLSSEKDHNCDCEVELL